MVPLLVGGAVLAFSLVLTALIWRIAESAQENRLRAAFDFRVEEAERLVLERMQDGERVLAGVTGLFAATREVNRSEFRRYVGSLDLPTSLPGFQAVGFQRIVPVESLADHVAAVRAEGFPDYAIRPEGRREAHAPVVFVEPATETNLRVLGFDPLAEPSRRSALDRARDTGTGALSGRVTLVQDADAEPVPGAVLYLPVYRHGSHPVTVEERRETLLGWVYLAFRVGDLIRGALGDAVPELDVAVLDGERAALDRRLYDSRSTFPAETGRPVGFEAERSLEVAGRQWILLARSTGALGQRAGAGQTAAIAGIAGVVVSALLAALAFLLAAQRVQVQEALRRSESLHQLLMRNFPNGAVALFDRDLRFTLADGTGSPAMGDPRTWTGRTLLELAPPDIRSGLEAAYRRALKGESSTVEAELRGRVVEVHLHPIRNGNGAVTMGVAMIQDVTERKRAEERVRSLQARLTLSSRLAALGTLVAGVAHEINNPLAAELANQGIALEVARTVRERLRGGSPFDPAAKARMLDEAVEALEEAQDAGLRIAAIVKDMAALAAFDPKWTRVRLADAVAEALRHLPPAVDGKSVLQVEDHGAPEVLAAPGQIEQVVVNLVTNAARASPAGTHADVRIRLGPGRAGMARLDVIDRGQGIDPAIRDRIFDPFFTTRPVGERRGKGLGLAICQAIVTAHGGTIGVESELGKGSTFTVELPAAPAA